MLTNAFFRFSIMSRSQKNLRFVVLSFTVIFLLTGVALVSIGSIYELTFQDLHQAIPESYRHLQAAPRLTITVGTANVISTFLGCAGTILPNWKFLLTHVGVRTTIFILQVSTIIFMSVQDYDGFFKSLNSTVPIIFQNISNSNFINLLQHELHCCGTTGPQFWNQTMDMPFPMTCCDSDCTHMYHDGCQDAIRDFVVEAVRVMGVAISAFAVVEIAGTVLGAVLVKLERKRVRYWEDF